LPPQANAPPFLSGQNFCESREKGGKPMVKDAGIAAHKNKPRDGKIKPTATPAT